MSTNYQMKNNLKEVLSVLKQHNYQITTVFDIGANKGRWTADYEQILPEAQFFMFEANPKHHKPNDINPKHRWFNQVLSSPDSNEVEFYRITTNNVGTGDSYYKEHTTYYDACETITLPTCSLDQLVSDNNIPVPQLIKLDTQGSEIDILRGAATLLKSVDIIYIEVPILPYNEDAPTFDEYINSIIKCGFVPIGIDDIHIPDNILMQVDIVFMKTTLKAKVYGGKNFWKGI